MTATTEQSVRDRLAAIGDVPSWLVEFCERTHGDWHFHTTIGPDKWGNKDISSHILIWTNGIRRAYVHYDHLRREIEHYKGSPARCIEAAWARITYMMDRVEGKD